MRYFHVINTETIEHHVWHVEAEDPASACLLAHQGVESGERDIQLTGGSMVEYSATECTPPDAPTLRLVP